MTAISELHSKL